MDLTLITRLPATDQSFDGRTSEFIKILGALRKTRLCSEGWFTSTPKFEGDSSGFDPITNPEGFSKHRTTEVEIPEEYQTEEYLENSGLIISEENYTFSARHPGDYPPIYSADFSGISAKNAFMMNFWKSHPQFGTDASLYIELIDTIIDWQRTMHLFVSPTRYFMDHHPLDRSRQGIGWMGWIPFDLPAHELPEAEIVRPMHGGTLIVTQSAFWQAFERHPAYSPQAIERAQEVELKLAMLGMLPTGEDLQSGEWGK